MNGKMYVAFFLKLLFVVETLKIVQNHHEILVFIDCNTNDV